MSAPTIAEAKFTAPVRVERPKADAGPGRPKRVNPMLALVKECVAFLDDETFAQQINVDGKSETPEVKRVILDIRAAGKELGYTACVRGQEGSVKGKAVTQLTYWLRPKITRTPPTGAAADPRPAAK